MRILFWGTPAFAVPSLLAIGDQGHEIVGVVTRPSQPAGRGRHPRASAVGAAALEEGLTVLEPESPRGTVFLEQVSSLEPELSVVVAYGRILQREVLDLPAAGSLNLHASLLPALRGPAPVNWAIVRGAAVTGVTVMRMVEEMDAGPILLQSEEPILPSDTASDLTARLAEIGAGALVEALALLETGGLDGVEQDEAEATYAPKVTRATARIDWSAPSSSAANFIRGMDAVPGAWSELVGRPVKLFRPRAEPDLDAQAPPGTILSADSRQALRVAAGSGAVRIGEVQPAGRNRMTAREWVLGRGAGVGQRFE